MFKEVYATLQRADTIGMFQVESRAQMASLPRNRPARFYDVVVQVAIIRPGPIVGKMMHPYMRRRQKKEPITYPHPSLEPVLKRTLGVPLFQEQLLRIAMTVANFSGAEAEELRRAVGMRRSWERMKNLEVKLRAGMTANGIDEKTQDKIVENISSFALYGFPESHAASFALLAYASAYFKVKYLAAFTCALLNNQPMGFYSPAVQEDAQSQPLQQMNVEERLVADYGGTGLTIGKHPMHYRRQALCRQGVLTASELQKRRNGEYVKTAGLAIVKQRPGTAKGVVFMSAADETGIFNIIVSKEFFEANKLTIKRCKFFLVEGKLQNEDDVVHVQAKRITQLSNNGLALSSHDFH